MTFLPLTKSLVPEIVEISKDLFEDGWSEQMLLDGLECGNLKGEICKFDGKTVGFITYSITCDFAEIDDVFVSKDYRKRGIATLFIQNLLNSIKGKTQKVFLEVRESNLTALNLYKKLGFRLVSVRKKYYSDGENALVLNKEI